MTALLADIKENNTGYLRINMKKKIRTITFCHISIVNGKKLDKIR